MAESMCDGGLDNVSVDVRRGLVFTAAHTDGRNAEVPGLCRFVESGVVKLSSVRTKVVSATNNRVARGVCSDCRKIAEKNKNKPNMCFSYEGGA